MIGADGAEEVIEIALDDEARKNLEVSVGEVKGLLEACKQIDEASPRPAPDDRLLGGEGAHDCRPS